MFNSSVSQGDQAPQSLYIGHIGVRDDKTHPHKDKGRGQHLVSVVESVVTTGVLVVYPVTHVTMLAHVA